MHPGETVTITVPEQPPAGSIVLDKGGKAWQRCDDRSFGSWFAASVQNAVDGYTWATLLMAVGPVTVLHVVEAS